MTEKYQDFSSFHMNVSNLFFCMPEFFSPLDLLKGKYAVTDVTIGFPHEKLDEHRVGEVRKISAK